MKKPIYTAEATVTGGREGGHGRTSDGSLEVELQPPTRGGGTNPEQLFAIGLAACFQQAVIVVSRRARADVGDMSIDAEVSLLAEADRTYTIAAQLDISLPSVDDLDAAKKIIAEAHRVCPYSNATRGNIDVTLIVNGAPVSQTSDVAA